MKHQYKCRQCGFIANGEAEGMKHQLDMLHAHIMDYICPDTDNKPSIDVKEGEDDKVWGNDE